MSLKKILMKGTTRISLHERFTFLRSQSSAEPSHPTVHMQSIRQGLFSEQQASAKNRRLAQMMDRRPTVMAALRLKKQRILKQRLGQARPGLSVKERLSLHGRGGGRGSLRGRVGQRGGPVSSGRSPLVRQRGGPRGSRRGQRGSLSRSQSLTNLSRSQSMQSLGGRRNLSVGGGGGRFQNRNAPNRQEFRRGGRGRGFRTRGNFNSNRDDFRGRRGVRGSRFNSQSQRSRGFRGGRGGRGRGARGQMPTREELDTQLDQYMSGSRGTLDRELDTYMNQQEESWD